MHMHMHMHISICNAYAYAYAYAYTYIHAYMYIARVRRTDQQRAAAAPSNCQFVPPLLCGCGKFSKVSALVHFTMYRHDRGYF